jgi:hypothetical protein
MKSIHALVFLLSLQLTAYGQVVINEICAVNGDLKYDPDFFDFPSFVELYNTGISSVDISNYYLSDDASQRGKWKFPSGTSIAAKGYLIVWCDSRSTMLHTNFNIDSDGEEIVLSNSQTEIDRITFSEQYLNISYGRLTDGGVSIGYLTSPTPGAKNISNTGIVRLDNPELSVKSGRYSSTQTVSIGPAAEGLEFRYTTDGSEPHSGSTLYSNPVSISKTTTLKAKAFREGYLPSKTEVKTYFINERTFTMPVVSVSTKPSFLFDNIIGIIADGTNGIPGNCMDQPRNWNQDWDRHAVFEYFDKTGEKIFDQQVDIRVHGGCSRNNPQKSLVLRARDKFGDKTIEHEFFSTKQINDFGAIVLRNAGNDFYYAWMRDALFQTLTIDQMDIDYLAYQPAIVYVNGTYWGIQDIREKVDGDYIEANFGIDRDDVDIIETFGNAIEGTPARYAMYLDSLQKISLSSPEAFTFISRYIDVQEFVNYLTTQIYIANTDWPGNNVKFWRQRSNNGKFRWILWDLDFGFGVYQWSSYPNHTTLDFATDPDQPGWPNPAWSTLHLRLLLQNPQFRNKLIQTMTTSLSTTFKPDRVVSMINTFQNNLKTEMPFHIQRWQLSLDNWNFEVNRLKTFAVERNAFMKTHIADFFGLNGEVRIDLNAYPVNAGTIELNGISNAPTVEDAFYYRDLPFDAVAVPAAGYKFSHFKIRKREALKLDLINRGSTWKYFDGGALPAADWMTASYSDVAWNEGQSELGYGDADEATQVSYGGDPSAKYITTYFRKIFSVADTVGLSSLSGSVLFDDGIVIYLNGEEVFRNNMPDGAVGYNTLAAANQSAETTFFGFSIPKEKVKPGNNVLAVEIHQNGAGSSDISFNLDLSVVQSGEETEYISAEPKVSDFANSDVSIEAYFVPAAVTPGLIINEFSANNTAISDDRGEKDDWIEIYNNSDQPVDVADYFVTDNLSNKLKHRIKRGSNDETVIAPGSYKILWADDDVEQGPLHLNFKLSDEGEEIGLYQLTGLIAEKSDEVTFGNQLPLTSFSRIPNVTGDFTLTALATPLEANIFEIPTAVEEFEDNFISVFPNPAGNSFRIKCDNGVMAVDVYSTTGRKVIGLNHYFSEDEISMANEAAGIYVVRVRTGARTFVKKLIKSR